MVVLQKNRLQPWTYTTAGLRGSHPILPKRPGCSLGPWQAPENKAKQPGCRGLTACVRACWEQTQSALPKLPSSDFSYYYRTGSVQKRKSCSLPIASKREESQYLLEILPQGGEVAQSVKNVCYISLRTRVQSPPPTREAGRDGTGL